MAHRLPVGIGENSSFFKLDIDIGSLHILPAHRLKISLLTEQDFKPDMTFTGHIQHGGYFIAVDLPQELTGYLSPDSRCLSEQLFCCRPGKHDLLRVFLYQIRIARQDRKTEYIKESGIYIGIFCFDQIGSRMEVQRAEVKHKGCVLHLREIFAECFAQRCHRIGGFFRLSALVPVHGYYTVDSVSVPMKILKRQFIHNP